MKGIKLILKISSAVESVGFWFYFTLIYDYSKSLAELILVSLKIIHVWFFLSTAFPLPMFFVLVDDCSFLQV